MISQQDIQDLISDVQNSKKYRELALPSAFLQNLIDQELSQAKNKRLLKEAFRKKLHEVIAPYLEDIDYPLETDRLISQSIQGMTIDQLKTWAKAIMRKHASTRERLPNLTSFYTTIWQHIDQPKSILDLACALDPLALPWFDNPQLESFYAVDIHKPRLNFLETFFNYYYPYAKVIHQDFIADPIEFQTDCVFLFKEVHRMEKRKPGSTRELIRTLNAHHIVISLPATDLRGHHSLLDYHNGLLEKIVSGLDVQVSQTQVGTELLYFIKKAETI